MDEIPVRLSIFTSDMLKASKRIMIYGDSLTWGRSPGAAERYDRKTRFTGFIADKLGRGYEVIEEGLRARIL